MRVCQTQPSPFSNQIRERRKRKDEKRKLISTFFCTRSLLIERRKSVRIIKGKKNTLILFFSPELNPSLRDEERRSALLRPGELEENCEMRPRPALRSSSLSLSLWPREASKQAANFPPPSLFGEERRRGSRENDRGGLSLLALG